jgi:hypothetical protein
VFMVYGTWVKVAENGVETHYFCVWYIRNESQQLVKCKIFKMKVVFFLYISMTVTRTQHRPQLKKKTRRDVMREYPLAQSSNKN